MVFTHRGTPHARRATGLHTTRSLQQLQIHPVTWPAASSTAPPFLTWPRLPWARCTPSCAVTASAALDAARGGFAQVAQRQHVSWAPARRLVGVAHADNGAAAVGLRVAAQTNPASARWALVTFGRRQPQRLPHVCVCCISLHITNHTKPGARRVAGGVGRPTGRGTSRCTPTLRALTCPGPRHPRAGNRVRRRQRRPPVRSHSI